MTEASSLQVVRLHILGLSMLTLFGLGIISFRIEKSGLIKRFCRLKPTLQLQTELKVGTGVGFSRHIKFKRNYSNLSNHHIKANINPTVFPIDSSNINTLASEVGISTTSICSSSIPPPSLTRIDSSTSA